MSNTPSAQKSTFSLRDIFYDPKIRSIFFQVALVFLLGYALYSIIDNTAKNLAERGISSGFGFLSTDSGFGLNQTLLEYSSSDSYSWALLIGFLNTILLAFLGIIAATILGFIVGVMRLSSNIIISGISTFYVEMIRNVPLLLQILFIYTGVLKLLPSARESFNIGDMFFLNIKGAYIPAVNFGGYGIIALVSVIVAIVFWVLLSRWATKRQDLTGQIFPTFWVGLGVLIALPLLALLVVGFPVTLDFSELKGFNFKGGTRIIPEFIALFVALAMYTSAFIAEIVRAGILSVSHGQTEAASSLGLPKNRTLSLIVIPQAMRVIIPPLTSQYLNLTKNSSLAVAIAYPDLVAVGGTVLNQSGQAIEIVAIWMTIYLTISLLTSAFMNWYNSRISLVER